MGLKNNSTSQFPNFFERDANLSFGEHPSTQSSNNIWKQYSLCGWFLAANC